MNVTLEKSFPLPGSAEVAWKILCDMEAVAGCMPGARITECIDAQQYKGTVSVKLGPASMSFRGAIEVRSVDAGSRSLTLVGRGTDATGSSGASMDLAARIEPVDALHCTLHGHSTVSLNGKAASFGGRMMGSVADQVLQQFAANFGSRVEQLQASHGAAGIASDGADALPIAASGATASATEPAPLNALSLLWGMIRDWFRSLFGTIRG